MTNQCDNGHELITFEGYNCPLCEYQIRYNKLLRRLEKEREIYESEANNRVWTAEAKLKKELKKIKKDREKLKEIRKIVMGKI